MPEIYLTQADRKRAEEKKARKELLKNIGCGLREYKEKNKLTNEKLGFQFGIGHSTIAKILVGEPIERISTEQYLDILEVSGMEIRKKGSVSEEIIYRELSKAFKTISKKLEAG